MCNITSVPTTGGRSVKYLEVKKSHPDEKKKYYLTAAAHAARDFLRTEKNLKKSPIYKDLDSE